MSEINTNGTEVADRSISEKDIAFMQRMAEKALDAISPEEFRHMNLDGSGWEARSLCGEMAYDPNSAVGHDQFLEGSKEDQIRLIAKYCFNCPVLQECRFATIQIDSNRDTDEIIGLQGGQTQHTRREQARYNRLLIATGSSDLAALPFDKGTNGRKAYKKPQASKTKNAHPEKPYADPDTQVAVLEIAKSLNTTKHLIHSLIKRHKIETSLHYGPGSNQLRSFVSSQNAILIEEIVSAKAQRSSEGSYRPN
jgi:hypothetical protein